MCCSSHSRYAIMFLPGLSCYANRSACPKSPPRCCVARAPLTTFRLLTLLLHYRVPVQYETMSSPRLQKVWVPNLFSLQSGTRFRCTKSSQCPLREQKRRPPPRRQTGPVRNKFAQTWPANMPTGSFLRLPFLLHRHAFVTPRRLAQRPRHNTTQTCPDWSRQASFRTFSAQPSFLLITSAERSNRVRQLHGRHGTRNLPLSSLERHTPQSLPALTCCNQTKRTHRQSAKVANSCVDGECPRRRMSCYNTAKASLSV